MVGCIAPYHYHSGFHHSGMSHFGYGYGHSFGHGFGHDSFAFDRSCDPCGPGVACAPEIACAPSANCATVLYSADICFPQMGTVVDCRTSLGNICNGVLLIGRGVRDIAAKPFVVIGNILSGGCRFKVLTACPGDHFGGSFYQSVDMCGPVSTSGCSSGCTTCEGGFIESIPFNGHFNGHNRHNGVQFNGNATQSRAPMLPAPPRRSSPVVQASHQEPVVSPTAPTVRFVKPR